MASSVLALIRFSRATANTPFAIGAKVRAYNAAATAATGSNLQLSEEPSYSSDEEYRAGVMNWDALGFALTPTDYMYTMKCGTNEAFEQGGLVEFGGIQLSPASGVLNYGQVPPFGKGSLYMRPMLLGSGAMLGVAPALEYTYLMYGSPVGNYFKEGSAPLKLYVEEDLHRSHQGGTGAVKSITNYGPVLRAMTKAKKQGYSDVLYLDPIHKRYIEEVSASNIFVVKGNKVSTPAATSGTILDGITRRSIIEIARELGYQVEERTIPVDELGDADEVFCTGTAVVVARVGSVTYKGNRIEYKPVAPSVAKQLQATLVGIQTGLVEDKKGWTVVVE